MEISWFFLTVATEGQAAGKMNTQRMVVRYFFSTFPLTDL